MQESVIRDGSETEASVTRVTAENITEVRKLIKECDRVWVATKINTGYANDSVFSQFGTLNQTPLHYVRISKQEANSWYRGLEGSRSFRTGSPFTENPQPPFMQITTYPTDETVPDYISRTWKSLYLTG
jgi:hypothetical protein